MTELDERQLSQAIAARTHSHGELPPWGVDDLPEPLPFTTRNALRVIGPGAILLAASIGGGEWLIGPAMSVRYGPSILWIATVAVAMQLIFNLEAIRYTLYTGEPILTGVLRLKPGPGWWATVYIFLACAQLGVPALASGCGTVLFAAFAGRLPDATIAADTANLLYVTYGVIALGLVILLSGRTIERTLEYASWFMILFIMTFLVVVNVLFVPAAHWGQTLVGFLHFGTLPKGMDLMLLATFAATAGSGGIGNLVISNWVRDKGYGMGSKVGAIGSAFSELGEHSVELAHVGTTFPITSDNLRRWGTWWTYVSLDQVLLWGGGCVVGMFLNVNLATFIAPPGTDLTKVGAGAFQAQYMAEQLWSGFWFLALLNGFWILFSTHLGNTDTLVRLVTDILWSASPALRCRSSTSSGRIYLYLLIVLTIWGCFAVRWGSAVSLFKILGVVAGPVLILGALQILRVNTTLLPVELRPPLWRRVALVLCAVFYTILSAAVLWEMVAAWLDSGVKAP